MTGDLARVRKAIFYSSLELARLLIGGLMYTIGSSCPIIGEKVRSPSITNIVASTIPFIYNITQFDFFNIGNFITFIFLIYKDFVITNN